MYGIRKIRTPVPIRENQGRQSLLVRVNKTVELADALILLAGTIFISLDVRIGEGFSDRLTVSERLSCLLLAVPRS